MRELITDIQYKRVQPPSVEAQNIPTSLKLTSDGGCKMTDTKRNAMAQQLREARGPAHIHIANANLLVPLVRYVMYSYPPSEDYMAFISSAKPITNYLVAARAKMSPAIFPHHASQTRYI